MPHPRVFVTRRIPEAAQDILRAACEVHTWDHEEEPVPQDELLRQLQQSDGALIVGPHRIDAAVMDAAPRCRVYANMAVGYDNIDVAEATRRGIMVTNTPGVLTETTADLAFALMLAAARRLYEGQRTIVEGRWKGWSPMFMTGQDVYGATLGIVGAGRIGQAVARRARGFNMRILYHNRRPNPAFEAEVGAEYRALDDLLRESDFVVLLVPLTPETRGLIGARELSLMKPTAVLVNAARGPVVDERALYEALRSRRIWAAGLDVFDQEPIPPDHPLLSLPNVTAVPHIGSATVRTRTAMAVLAAENLVAGVTGRRPSNLVNPEVFQG
ncbi:MAG: D-glycerate dehydrogenase [Symbiobacterium sp.]|jgi:D-isomer specific 2-hydroxyacid dehydrogenase, NAD binding domain.|uniref:2-hydroxyacid dehydrogenase n=1 Tax=Symbiobacterium sp. TaxID=1971213 RepID=UPI003464A242